VVKKEEMGGGLDNWQREKKLKRADKSSARFRIQGKVHRRNGKIWGRGRGGGGVLNLKTGEHLNKEKQGKGGLLA